MPGGRGRARPPHPGCPTAPAPPPPGGTAPPAPAPGDAKPPPSNLIEASRRRRLVFPSVQEAIDRFCSKPPFAQCEPEAVRAYVEVGTTPQADGTVKLTCTGETEASIYESNEQL